MGRDAGTRIRLRMRARLDELGMTGRELARAVRPDVEDREVDSWMSGILTGAQGLHWKYFDAVAAALRMTPTELVRLDETNLRELTPQEMKLLRHYQTWPAEVRDRWIGMLDYFASTVPDAETARLLDRLRATPRSLRRPVLEWLLHLLEEGIPPEVATVGGAPGDSRRIRRDRYHAS